MKALSEKPRNSLTASLSKSLDTDSLLIHCVAFDGENLKDRTKSEELRRHRVKMKKVRHFNSTKWKSKAEIREFVRKKPDCGSMDSKFISWALFVCILFIVSCSQQNCDIISQEQHQEKKIINKQYSVNRSPIIRLFASDIGVSRAELAGSLDWLDDESAQSIYSQKFQRNNQPYFRPKQARRVIASRWQTEVFLPCQIENLDEEQTVSKSG